MTRRACYLAVLLLVVLPGCPNKQEIGVAKRSVYDTDFAIVYSETLAVMRELYPYLSEDPRTGRITTANHEVKWSNSADDPRQTARQNQMLGGDPAVGGNFAAPAGSIRDRYFIRFEVTVTGGKPWRVRVVATASKQAPGDALPTTLEGAARPPWLTGRRDAVIVEVYKRLKKYAIQLAEPEAEPEEELLTIDPSIFGDIPPDAAKTAAAIVKAIEVRDVPALRAQLADDVLWSLGADGDAETAMVAWQADPEALASLARTLRAGCAKTPEENVLCPAAAVGDAAYLDWRAVLELRGDAWKLAAFVRGD